MPRFVHALRCASFDLVLVGAHFDGSRAIEAVMAARTHAAGTPLACVRAAVFATPLGEATLAAFRSAAQELGAECFVDVLQFPDNAEGNARLRRIFEALAFFTDCTPWTPLAIASARCAISRDSTKPDCVRS